MAFLIRRLTAWACGALLLAALAGAAGGGDSPTEYQVKAVFVYNFSHFVEWPAQAYPDPKAPFVIGILGDDPFGGRLDEAVRGEQIEQHPLEVRRIHNVDQIGDCRILYIDRAEAAQLKEILTVLDHHSTLTVSELDDSSQRGVMIQFVTENSRIRLRINVDSARAAGLIISSKLLRPAEIVTTRKGD
ncbi:MAG TPA: YfiR family protein [Steroidobacteraceae bacterium]|nr:YfiR family protein [Steroidobacteraceae bacterium]